MITSAPPPTVLADTISGDQLTQLAAVMLGLVVFAAIFALIERQRSRRGKDHGEVQPPPIDPPPSTPPPRYVSDEPAVPITVAPPPPAAPGVMPDNLPVPFVHRAHEPAAEEASRPGSEPPATSPVETVPPAAQAAAEPTVPGQAQVPESPPADHTAHAPEPTSPESPDDFGIVLPDEPSPSGSGGAEPRS
jgi:hypothetical protein